MIRRYQAEDLEPLMAIWLAGNLQVHHFIDKKFFQDSYEMVKILLPTSTVYVQDLHGVKGFIGLIDNYIAGLFVNSDYHHQGIGSALVAKAKQLHNQLFVHVYEENTAAIAFYLAQGFEIATHGINEETNEPELFMQCTVQHSVKIGKCAL